MADHPQERIRMTAKEFMALPETSTPTQLIDGEVVVSPAPKYDHQRLVFHIAKFIDQRATDGITVISPMDVHFDDEDVVQPDIFWVSNDNPNCTLSEDGYWHGAPDFVVEVLSPSSVKYDRGAKYNLYERHGVREYWLVEPAARFIEIYVRGDERFIRQGLYVASDTFTSSVLSEQSIKATLLLGEG